MDVARALPSELRPVTVVAKSQTAGRGRFDRVWTSPPRGGLYLTVRIPWIRALAQAPLVSMGTALALARLSSLLGCPEIELKWPNDLLLGGRKAAGILAEMHHPPHGIPQLLVGVGVNVSMEARTLETVGQPATSLCSASGRELDAQSVLEQFLSLWSQVDLVLETSGFQALVEEYRAYSDLAGRMFRLAGAQGEAEDVRAISIQDDGALVVELVATGLRKVVHGGELLPSQGLRRGP